MQPNFRIQLLDEEYAELQCNACARGRRMRRA